MREIVSIIDTDNYDIENEVMLEEYACLLRESRVDIINLLVMKTKEINVSIFERMKEIFDNHEVTLKYYLCDVFDASSSFYKMVNNKRITTCNGSQYVFIDLPYDESFSEYLYDYLLSVLQMNYKPVLLHVERHLYLIDNEELLKELIDLGCYVSVSFQGINDENAYKILNIHALGLCHMMFSEFFINPENELKFRFWLTYSTTQYVTDIVMSDNVYCMIDNKELLGISTVTNILKHPTLDSKLADNRWLK